MSLANSSWQVSYVGHVNHLLTQRPSTCSTIIHTVNNTIINSTIHFVRHVIEELKGNIWRPNGDRNIILIVLLVRYVQVANGIGLYTHLLSQECRRILREEYYEMNGRVYCERHAFKLSQQSALLGPGRRNPERRTTRMLVMG